MKRLYFLIFVLIPLFAVAQVDPGLAEALQSTLDEHRIQLDAKGLGASVIIPGDEIWQGVSGISGVGTDLTTDFTFGVGSVNKTFTASVLAQLHVDGVLSLDDSLSKWLPTFPNVDSTATIRQCLNHTTGIFDYRADPTLFETVLGDAARIWTPEEILETFVHAPNFAPGESWSYSNTNYTLAGMVIKSATGKEYYEMYKEMFFDPLGLTSAIGAPFQTNSNPLADLWFDALIPGIPINISNLFSTNGLFSIGNSAGGIVATPRDMAVWIKALATGKAVSDEALNEMKQFLPVGAGGYGLGVSSGEVNGESVFGHSGNIVYVSEVYYFPGLDISIALHSNDGTKFDLTAVFADLMETYKNYDPSSVSEISAVSQIELFPNPASDYVNLNFELEEKSAVQISVFDILGNKVSTLFSGDLPTGEYKKQFPLDIAKGTYLIKMELEESTFVERIVKY